MKMIWSELEFPLGAMLLVTDDQGRVRALEFAERRSRLHRILWSQYGACELAGGPAPHAVANALRRYFEGELDALDGIEVASAGTEEQERAWAALRRVRAGQTTTYGAIGKSMGIDDWRASVDAGAAVGANPIALFVPCHRVLGTNGDLKGYAWGLHRKRWLLEHEAAIEIRPAAPQTGALF
jgi:methylated-DNA-[protein]-cysteine S-methyltransferase